MTRGKIPTDKQECVVTFAGMVDRTFADLLRVYLDEHPDLTPSRLALDAGLDNSTVRQILSGKAKNPRIDTAMRICAALGTTLEEFMGLEVDQSRQEILQLYTQLPDDARRLLLAAARGLSDTQKG